MKETTNCIVCNKKAEIWSGHVVKFSLKNKPKKIIAGWCRYCDSIYRNRPGFFGRWRKRHGEITNNITRSGAF